MSKQVITSKLFASAQNDGVWQATQAAGVDAAEGKLALLINPQWQPGQVISDFGLGAKRRDCEKFLGAFQDVYYLRQQRISGDEIL